ncbi:MAG: DUF2520 domain-containing protein [Candidatus Kapabacteria bacterium]|nr:DUF2520 domain-containing protein [Candidatus Kapabacteria bacterium]
MLISVTIIGSGRVGTSIAKYGSTEVRNDGGTEVQQRHSREGGNLCTMTINNSPPPWPWGAGIHAFNRHSRERGNPSSEERHSRERGNPSSEERHSRERGNPSSEGLHASLISAREFLADPASTVIERSDVIVLATKDAVLTEVVGKLATHHSKVLRGALVLHVNGSLGADILEPLARHGAHVAAAHPFQTFSTADPALLTGIGWGVECDAAAWPLTEQFVRLVGGFPFLLPNTDAVSKRRYHAAAVAASNFTYAAYDLALRLAEDVGLPPTEFLVPIMRQTLENAIDAIAHNTPFPITGPLVRGDVEAVQRQLDAMPEHLKDQYVHLTEALRKTVGRE